MFILPVVGMDIFWNHPMHYNGGGGVAEWLERRI